MIAGKPESRADSFDFGWHYMATKIDEEADWEAIKGKSISEQGFRFACDGVVRERAVSEPFAHAAKYWADHG